MGFRSGMLSGQSSTAISWSANHLEVLLALWAGAKFLLEKEISISIMLVSRWKHKVLLNLPVDGYIDFWTWENTVDQHQQTSRHPKSSLTSETSQWTSSNMDSVPLHSSSRLQTLISKWKATFIFIWKEDFGPLSNSPVLFLLSPGKMLLMMFLFQKWLGSPFPEDVWAWWLLMHWLQLQLTPCEALPSVWIGFAWQYSQACGHPCCLCRFSNPISSFQSTLHLIVTALCEQLPLSEMTLSVEGVNDRLLDHCQVSSVPHYCGFKEQEIPRIYTVWIVIYWNSNVNILLFWDTYFWHSIAVRSNHKN